MVLGRLRQRLPGGSAVDATVPFDPATAEPEPATSSDGIEIEFAGYAEDCRLFGFVLLTAERLTDALNDSEAFDLSDVLVVALDGQTATEMRQLTVSRDELLAVRASGPRGNAVRRGRTRPSPITLRTGPYTIHGYVHGPPGADPIQAMRRRKPMVPLTEAWIEYKSDGEAHRARVGTIIVNREVVDWFRLSKHEEAHLPDLPAESRIDPRAKDMTGYIFTVEGSGEDEAP